MGVAMTWTKKDRLQLVLISSIATVTAINFMLETALPRLHGRIFPAVGPFQITGIFKGNEDYTSRIAGYAIKNNECAFKGVEWALGARNGRYADTSARFLDETAIRSEGVQYWNALMIDLTPSQIRNNSFGSVWHDCGFPWRVRTAFYDPPQKG